jgi:cytochrome c oxidase subunit IV
MGLTYEKSKSIVLKTILILGVITLFEVFMALLGKGYVISGISFPLWLMAILMIGMSLVKAYFIVYEFMHMKYEVPGLMKSVLLPTLLLVWAIIAFFYEGNDWKNRRALIDNKNSEEVRGVVPEGTLIKELDEIDYRF